jgi:hypothetical protein
MSDFGLFVGFGTPVRGREKRAVELFNESLQYYASLQQKGTIDSFEVALLEPHGGELGGFILLRGQRDKIAQLRTDQEFVRLTNKAALAVEDIGIVGAVFGGELQRQMGEYIEEVGAVPQLA